MQPTYSQARPKNWLIESIPVTLLCFLPFGIYALVNAVKVNREFENGNKKNKTMKIIIALFLSTASLINLSCRKPSQDIMPLVNVTPCLVTSAPSYFGTTQTFSYNNNEQLTSLTFDFGSPGYGPFTQTVGPTQTISTSTRNGTTLQVRNVFLGGTGNLYDGMPTILTRVETQTNSSGQAATYRWDTLFSFTYDDKKRLIQTFNYSRLEPYNPRTSYARVLFGTKLKMTYDSSDNVINLQQFAVYRSGAYVATNPSASYFAYVDEMMTDMNITYDDKPSPYSAMLKYWKFVQNDWGLAINSSWPAIIASLSKHNALKVTFKTRISAPSNYSFSSTYNYNAQGFPIDGYTYKCK